MRPISRPVRKIIDTDPYYRQCARAKLELTNSCSGRITMEHAFINGGNQMDEAWAIVPLCWYHHLGEGLVKWINKFLALTRATEADLLKYPRTDWEQQRTYLTKKMLSKQIGEWLVSDDTGASSKAIAAVMLGADPAVVGARVGGTWPRDPSDFGRCVRLVRHVWGGAQHLEKMREVHPKWNAVVDNWDEWCELYDKGANGITTAGPDLFKLMKDAGL